MDATLSMGMAKDGATARQLLTADEVRTCALLPCRVQRRDFRAGRLAERRALRGRDGQGAVVSSDRCDGHAVALAAPEGVRVGVALEREGAVRLHAVEGALTAFELRLAEHMDPTILWSAKRAVRAALGLGDSVDMADIELAPEPSGQLVGAWVRGAFLPLHVRLSEPWAGFFMTTVWISGATA